MIKSNKINTLEQYMTPLCEMLCFDAEQHVLCTSTNVPFDDNSNWDGIGGWE